MPFPCNTDALMCPISSQEMPAISIPPNTSVLCLLLFSLRSCLLWLQFLCRCVFSEMKLQTKKSSPFVTSGWGKHPAPAHPLPITKPEPCVSRGSHFLHHRSQLSARGALRDCPCTHQDLAHEDIVQRW